MWTILNSDNITSGVIVRKFCSFSCPEEATGDIKMEFNGDWLDIPVCEEHAKLLLDNGNPVVLD